jgi:trigger factor
MESDFAEDAKSSIKARLILDTIVKTEGIEIADEELDNEIAERAAAMQGTPESYRDFLEQRGMLAGLKEELAREKALKLVVESAVLV